MKTVGRNGRCPCGSGKKHGRCCWTEHPCLALDRDVTERALLWTIRTRGVEWLAGACGLWRRHFPQLETLGNWLWTCLLHHHEPGLFGDFLLDEEGLSLAHFAVAQAREHGRTSIYTVLPQRRGLVLGDMLDPALSFTVHNCWPQLRRNTVVLGRVVHIQGESLLLSMHPQTLGRVFGLTVCQMLGADDGVLTLTARWQQVADRLELPVRLGRGPSATTDAGG